MLFAQGEEEQRWVQSAARKDAECQLCAPVTRKRRATLASFDTTADLDSKKQKVYNLQADSRLAAFAAGAVQHCIRSSSGGQMLPEAWGFGSQQSHEHALEAMGASSEEQEAMDILLSLSEETTTPFGEGAVI